MTSVKMQRVAAIGQMVLGGVILALQVAGLIRSHAARPDVGPASS